MLPYSFGDNSPSVSSERSCASWRCAEEIPFDSISHVSCLLTISSVLGFLLAAETNTETQLWRGRFFFGGLHYFLPCRSLQYCLTSSSRTGPRRKTTANTESINVRSETSRKSNCWKKTLKYTKKKESLRFHKKKKRKTSAERGYLKGFRTFRTW